MYCNPFKTHLNPSKVQSKCPIQATPAAVEKNAQSVRKALYKFNVPLVLPAFVHQTVQGESAGQREAHPMHGQESQANTGTEWPGTYMLSAMVAVIDKLCGAES